MGVGDSLDYFSFEEGSAALRDGSTSRWFNDLDPPDRAALSDPSAYVIVDGHASRSGEKDDNHELSSERGFAVAREIEEIGVEATIVVRAHGEERAEREGKVDDLDDVNDRVVEITVLPAASSELLPTETALPEDERLYTQRFYDETIGRALENQDPAVVGAVVAFPPVTILFAGGVLAAHLLDTLKSYANGTSTELKIIESLSSGVTPQDAIEEMKRTALDDMTRLDSDDASDSFSQRGSPAEYDAESGGGGERPDAFRTPDEAVTDATDGASLRSGSTQPRDSGEDAEHSRNSDDEAEQPGRNGSVDVFLELTDEELGPPVESTVEDDAFEAE